MVVVMVIVDIIFMELFVENLAQYGCGCTHIQIRSIGNCSLNIRDLPGKRGIV